MPLNITVGRDSEQAAAAMARATDQSGEAREASRAKAATMREKARAEAAGVADTPQAPLVLDADPSGTIAPPTTVEVPLPSGIVVEYGPPSRVSLERKANEIHRGINATGMDSLMTRTALCVRAIDGKPVAPCRNLIERDKIIDAIGDDGLAALAMAHQRYWPARANIDDLAIIEKN